MQSLGSILSTLNPNWRTGFATGVSSAALRGGSAAQAQAGVFSGGYSGVAPVPQYSVGVRQQLFVQGWRQAR